ncbi:MAG: hypothetical protein U0X20_07900 [Caldilineaceae bacterium]
MCSGVAKRGGVNPPVAAAAQCNNCELALGGVASVMVIVGRLTTTQHALLGLLVREDAVTDGLLHGFLAGNLFLVI